MTDEPNPWVPGQGVRVSRDIPDTLDIRGLVVAESDEWVVLQEEYEYFLTGFVAIRRDDIELVVVDDFMPRALQAVGEVSSDPGQLDLSTTESLVASIAEHHPLVVIHTEYDDDTDVCWVGQVRECGDGRMRLREISPKAEWDDQDSDWELNDVSMMNFGSRYDRALWLVGGPPPDSTA